MADYYDTLGVSRNASDKDLKTAFRKLAAKHHPDAGGDAEKFKEINEAYNTLKDPQKRQMYDQFGSTDSHQAQQNPFGQPRRRQNRNIRIGYTINLQDVFNGVGNTITYQLPSGRQEVIDVRIPAGVKDGDSVRVQGYGDNSIKDLPRGDLIIKVKVNQLPNWRREGDNIYTMKELDVFDLLIGTKIPLNTPDNKNITINIPAGTNSGTTLSVTGYGTPNVNTSRRGNLYVTVKGITPKLEQNEIEEIRKIKDGINLRTK